MMERLFGEGWETPFWIGYLVPLSPFIAYGLYRVCRFYIFAAREFYGRIWSGQP